MLIGIAGSLLAVYGCIFALMRASAQADAAASGFVLSAPSTMLEGPKPSAEQQAN